MKTFLSHKNLTVLLFTLSVWVTPLFLWGSEPINRQCIVTPGEAVDPEFTFEYKGQTIGFCCRDCIQDFKEDPEQYLKNLPTESKEAEGLPVAQEHDHATDHKLDVEAATPFSERLVNWLGKFHVLVIHFPIAFLLFAAFWELVFLIRKQEVFHTYSKMSFAVGSLFSLVAAGLGWLAAAGGTFTGTRAEILYFHRILGTSVAALVLISWATFLFARKKGWNEKRLYVFWVFMIAILVAITAHFGGSLVYGSSYFQFPAAHT